MWALVDRPHWPQGIPPRGQAARAHIGLCVVRGGCESAHAGHARHSRDGRHCRAGVVTVFVLVIVFLTVAGGADADGFADGLGFVLGLLFSTASSISIAFVVGVGFDCCIDFGLSPKFNCGGLTVYQSCFPLGSPNTNEPCVFTGSCDDDDSCSNPWEAIDPIF